MKYVATRWNKQRSAFYLLGCLMFLALPLVLPRGSVAAQTTTDLSGVNVAVYSGGPFEPGNNSRTALTHMFEWMGATVALISPEQIRNQELWGYDILVIPGIPPANTYVELWQEGVEQIRQFVANGGSYFGICGGSVFGMSGNLGFFDGTLRGPIPGVAGGIHLTTMAVNHESTGPDLSALPANYSLLFWDSGYWYKEDMSGVITVASYPTNGQPGMIASRYGYGTYFLSSPHPEWEEGDPRDGTAYFDEYNDPDSEWPLMLSVANWLVDASPAPPPPGPNLGLIAVAAVGVAIGAGAVVALVFILKRR